MQSPKIYTDKLICAIEHPHKKEENERNFCKRCNLMTIFMSVFGCIEM